LFPNCRHYNQYFIVDTPCPDNKVAPRPTSVNNDSELQFSAVSTNHHLIICILVQTHTQNPNFPLEVEPLPSGYASVGTQS